MPTTKRYYFLTILSVAFLAHLTWRMSYFERNTRYCLDCGQIEYTTYFSIHVCKWLPVDIPIQGRQNIFPPLQLTELLDPNSLCTHPKMETWSTRNMDLSILIPYWGWVTEFHPATFFPFSFDSNLIEFQLYPDFKQYVLRERPDIIKKIHKWFYTQSRSSDIQSYIHTEYDKWKESTATSNPQAQPATETQPAD